MVRVRFAPSPTGYLHLGNARTALFNWLFARKNNGSFILRIEDTDVERSSDESMNEIMDSLKWLGLNWDEGPDVGGKFGPYRQSQRLDIYNRFVKVLEDGEFVYKCFCTEDELEKKRKKMLAEGLAPKYDRKCLDLTDAQINENVSSGKPHVFRFRVPERDVEFEDIVRGKVSFSSETIGDFIIMRSSGMPAFNFSVVIDDICMEITHIIRGEDHLPNTPRHIMLYEVLGKHPPKYAHLSMILGPDGSKLSKRHGMTSVSEYRKQGYLPEAMVNYLALLGWSSESGDDIMDLNRIVKEFSIERVSGSSAIFDNKKLDWINTQYMAKMNTGKFLDICLPYIMESGYVKKEEIDAKREWLGLVVESVKTYVSKPSEIAQHIGLYFDGDFQIDEDAIILINTDIGKGILKQYANRLSEIAKDGTLDVKKLISSVTKEIATAINAKPKELYMCFRAGITGKLHGPELDKIVQILGLEECVRRIRKVLGKL